MVDHMIPIVRSEETEDPRFALPDSTALIAEIWSAPIVTDGEALSVTVTEQVALFPPSSVVTVMVVDPALTAVTFPSMTVATPASALLHLMFLFVALSGLTVAVSKALFPSSRFMDSGLSDTDVTGIAPLGFPDPPSGFSGSFPRHELMPIKTKIDRKKAQSPFRGDSLKYILRMDAESYVNLNPSIRRKRDGSKNRRNGRHSPRKLWPKRNSRSLQGPDDTP